jgi:hypothetical protein
MTADRLARADLARGRLHAQLPALRLALEGRLPPHQQVLRRQMLAHSTVLAAALAQVDVQQVIYNQQPYMAVVISVEFLTEINIPTS